MSNLSSNVKNIISDLSKKKKFSLGLENNEIIINKSKNKITKEEAENFVNFLKENRKDIEKGFAEAYEDQIDCSNFHKAIQELYKIAQTEEKDRVNYFNSYTSNWMEKLSKEDKEKPLKNFLKNNSEKIVVINVKIDRPYKASFGAESQNQFLDMLNKNLGEYMKAGASTNQSINSLVKQGNRLFIYSDLPKASKEKFGAIKQASQVKELWPDKTTETEVIKDLKNQVKNISPNKFNYASLNTTPNTDSILGGILSNDDLKKRGKNIQANKGDEFLAIAAKEKGKLQAVILDSPKKSFVQKIINQNRNKTQKQYK